MHNFLRESNFKNSHFSLTWHFLYSPSHGTYSVFSHPRTLSNWLVLQNTDRCGNAAQFPNPLSLYIQPAWIGGVAELWAEARELAPKSLLVILKLWEFYSLGFYPLRYLSTDIWFACHEGSLSSLVSSFEQFCLLPQTLSIRCKFSVTLYISLNISSVFVIFTSTSPWTIWIPYTFYIEIKYFWYSHIFFNIFNFLCYVNIWSVHEYVWNFHLVSDL